MRSDTNFKHYFVVAAVLFIPARVAFRLTQRSDVVLRLLAQR